MTKHPKNPAKLPKPRPSPAARYAAFHPVCDCNGTGKCPTCRGKWPRVMGCVDCDSTGLCLKCQMTVSYNAPC